MTDLIDLEINDCRVEFLAIYILKTFKLKPDRWVKMYSNDDNRSIIFDFFTRHDHPFIVFSVTGQNTLMVAYTYPTQMKFKSCFFAKRNKLQINKEDDFRKELLFGDLAYLPVNMLSTLLEEMYVPVFQKPSNQVDWPKFIANDLNRHINILKNKTYVILGQMKGKTQLPIPAGAESVSDKDIYRAERGEAVDQSLIHSIESVVIDWTHQIHDIIKKDSARPILDGLDPHPMFEVEFWISKYNNLDNIFEQLNDSRAKKMALLLEKTQSSYFPAFRELFSETHEALVEATDINNHLKPLIIYFEQLETEDFLKIKNIFDLVFHLVCLVWAHSKYYCRPTRLVVLLQELNNQLMKRAKDFLEPINLFKGEPEESMEKIKKTFDILQCYVNSYETHKLKIMSYFKNGIPPRDWEFSPKLVWHNWDKFMERLNMIRDLFKTAIDFHRLEKVEIGGVKGKALSLKVFKIFEEFKEEFDKFNNKTYDPLDRLCDEFNDDFIDFNKFVLDLDKRLAAVIIQAFEDCNGLNSVFKLITILGQLLLRKAIKLEFEPKYAIIVYMLEEEMDHTKIIYDEQIKKYKTTNEIDVHRNMPEVSGSLRWCKELKERIAIPMAIFKKSIDNPVGHSEHMDRVNKKYNELIILLDQFAHNIYVEWCSHVGGLSDDNLEKNLIYRDSKSKSIKTNFDPQLIAVLNEVKQLDILKITDIPEEAIRIYSNNNQYRSFITSLDYTVDSYNKIILNASVVEKPLIQDDLNQIDIELEKAEKILKWKSPNIHEYISNNQNTVHSLEHRLQKSKFNLEKITQLMNTWQGNPLFKRYEQPSKTTLLQLDDMQLRLDNRYKEVVNVGIKIHDLIEENKNLLQAKDDNSEIWKHYTESVDKLVVEGYHRLLQTSLSYFLKETDFIKNNPDPLFEIQLRLDPPEILFAPSLEPDVDDCFLNQIRKLVESVYKQTTLIKRIASHLNKENYEHDLESQVDLKTLKNELIDRINSAISKSIFYKDSYNRYAYLWTDDRKEFMRQFLLYSHVLTPEEIEAHAETGVPENPPTLEEFQNQVSNFEGIYEEITKIEDVQIIDKWLKIDSKPFKTVLLNVIKKWSFMFKQHLMDDVTNNLKELDQFIKEKDKALIRDVRKGDYRALVAMMGHLAAVREKTALFDNMFDPIKKKIELLKTYDQEIPDDVYERLQKLPDKWANTKKLSLQAKQHVMPLQTDELANIKRKITACDIEQQNYRESFKDDAPFKYTTTNPYDKLDKSQENLSYLESKISILDQSAQLFELPVTDFKQLRMCRKEIKMLKALWDYTSIVTSTFDDWKKTKWREINAESMDSDCKKFAKEIRSLDKEMRTWDTFIGIDNDIKNLITALRAVTELQNQSIRDRHWNELMQATGVVFTMSDDTTFAELLALNLHKFEDEVKGIVDKAVKESTMEKIIRELDATWTTMKFDTEPHLRTKQALLQPTDELIETLEDNQVQLQNMLTSKYIAHFSIEVNSWQKKLSQADLVLTIMLEVQRTWSHLESIFVGSEDIRNQLPEDSNRFDKIDREFGFICEENVKDLNVIACTNRENLYERLEVIQEDLALCEKALAEYLETKRVAFPRFYFVSSADLLDILSNGNEPEKVMKHLTKLFDSMAKLKIDKSKAKFALSMISKEGEEVPFPEPLDLNCQVETWLNRLLDMQCNTILYWMTDAVQLYEEKSREQWILEFPGQVALTGSQIWWTTEVNIAFGKLEEGFENALKDYYKKQVAQLNNLITLLLGDLSKGNRQKIMTICTIDVHARDVVTKMIAAKIENAGEFLWQCQLRHRWDDEKRDCFANICDAQFKYAHEYLGNQPRLVITPLTDRCYITLTQSLHLIMGGAPSGPAGTGKTETTKDLGRALGFIVYVFNCSEQMDYKSCGNIYKGLAQTGAWGCFDEFNRILVEVLSVIAVQVKAIQDAIRDKKKMFFFMGEDINLNPTVGIFITMNPGYAGRAELPENLKALFRPCAMVVPDFDLISEIMLVAEGFTEARLLARKFITLYTLCKELLSKQDHYDWGLRAIKSVLVVAGSLRRGERDRPEDQVLIRALRDFNTPKIVTDDLPIFMGLIGDLFPALDVPRKRDADFEKLVKQATIDMKLQPEEGFILKVVQLQEIFEVRHSVFIIGNACTGKSQIWKTLIRTYQNQKKKTSAVDLNPKTVSNDELYGIINPTTREWKDGLFSVLMRDLANVTHDGPKWIILDGDIDPMWIESLNTVMDDNKVLTLASNERIPLSPTMRLLFEISHLKTATPATVSRAGILYINPGDLGWNPQVYSWIDTREVQSEKANLTILFDKYVPPCLEILRTRFKKITPIVENTHVNMICNLLECLLTPQNIPVDATKEIYELYFVFAAVWGFGSGLYADNLHDHRLEFSKWWNSEFKGVKFPQNGTVFDFYIDSETKKLEPWTKLVNKFTLESDIPLQSVLVSTNETTRIRYFIDLLLEKGRPIMLVGAAGTGKTVLMNDKLNSLSDDWVCVNVPFNFYTTSEMLQNVLEKPLEKKAGRNYGPPGAKRLIYFIDDMNMPEVDEYGTVQPHTILRQYLDYKHWYDRQKLTLKEINNCQYVSCMNPTSGSFTIDPRLQRHFTVFAVSFPGTDALQTIYHSILSQNLANGFLPNVSKYSLSIVNLALQLHQRVSTTFLPTAIKFHYIFNLRDLSNIFQGILFAKPDSVKTGTDLIRLYLHESERVYSDKLVDKEDARTFIKLQREVIKKALEESKDIVEEECFRKPNIYCHFSQGIGDSKYSPIPGWEQLNRLLTDALVNYNELNAAMNLVLFEDAMMNICRINRILESPRGNALLIGVGGSGKQSLSRLAASISSLEVFQITLRKGYSISDLKSDIFQLYVKAGTKNIGIVFLMTDAQVADEKFLVLINDLLASGEIPGLFPDDQIEEMIGAVRNEAKTQGIDDTRENCWRFFIDKVRRLLKVVLCFSPVGSTLRVRSRKFPAIINCTNINLFHEWPEEALKSVAKRFLSEVDLLSTELQESIGEFMAYVHKSVNDMSIIYLQNDKRYNYTTPKSFLEQISLYKRLLEVKFNELQGKIVRLENGLVKLQSTAKQVDELKEKLATQEVEVKQKNEDADKLIKIVGDESEKVSLEKTIADEEQTRVSEISIEVGIKKIECETDLAKALPALEAAQRALDTLDKNSLTEMKTFTNPPAAVLLVASALVVMLAPGGKVPKDRSWKTAKAMMGNVDKFLEALKTYDKDNVPESCRKEVQVYIKDPLFVPELVKSQSSAAAGLCSWCINILIYYGVYCEVAPKRAALAKANAELQAAKDKLAAVEKKVIDLEEKLRLLTAQFEEVNAVKKKCEEDAQATAYTISLANRLVGGLSSEKIRWTEAVAQFKIQEKMLPGNILLVTAFVSYVGCFTKNYRLDLMDKFWMPYLRKLKENFDFELSEKVPIPISAGLDILTLLIDDADIAEWNNDGLPGDRMSVENATILTCCDRWPLMIDPQLQGIKWIKTKYGDSLKIIRLGQKNYLEQIESAISSGDVLLFENIEESIEAVLDPLLGRNTIKKGKAIKIGDKEVEYHPNFKLILHTKLANPHYKPEMQAQTTLINFTVTRDGLEDQILADIVAKERPDLEKLKSALTRENNQYKITLKKLEDSLLAKLSAASGNFLGDIELVENLENTKSTAMGIEEKVKEAKITSTKIDEAREFYRPAAARASLIYFIMNDLNKIHPMYQFSLKAFKTVFSKAIERADPAEEIKQRVLNLIDSITYNVFIYTTRGLFEKHKLIFTAQMTFLILAVAKEIETTELDFLLRFPVTVNVTSPVDFLNDYCWGGIKWLSGMDAFTNLDRDIEGSSKRWKKFSEGESPEKDKFPQEWKSKTSLQKLCMMRALRPDRMLYALSLFVEEKLGRKYTENRSVDFSRSYEETTPSTPVFFILSPGLDPLKDVERIGKTMGFTMDNRNFHNISLGQGQEVVAEQAMEVAAKEGHWVVLQNIHLVSSWLSTLEKHLEKHGENSHDNFRMFISAEPASESAGHIIPQGILESAIKITNEPPTGMQANIHKAFDNFNQDTMEMCSKETEFKSILFALCYFHAVVAERRKFGPQGWNKNYPFNTGDLSISVNVLYNYLEGNAKVPWENLRYLFGEIMYGGHITDDWDRRLCRTYLEEFMNPVMFDGELNLAPGFPVPPSSDFKTYHIYIDENIPAESPYLYGLHPNAEIDFLTTTSENLFKTVLELQPRDIGTNNDEGTQTREEKIKQKLDDILDRLPEDFSIRDLMSKTEEKSPYTIVAIQECERMNILTTEIRRSLSELNLGLKGELTITPEMEGLQDALFFDCIPHSWTKRAYPSMFSLGQWYSDLIQRIKELDSWTADFVLPPAVWLGGLFNPQSFLTAIMQTTARKNEWPLDKMCISVEVTKKTKDDLGGAPREGAYTCGLYIEGARWDMTLGQIAESNLKELTPLMPVIFIKAIPVDRKEIKNIYECPLYKTKNRGPTFVWTFGLKTKEKSAKWVLGGVALLLQV